MQLGLFTSCSVFLAHRVYWKEDFEEVIASRRGRERERVGGKPVMKMEWDEKESLKSQLGHRIC